MASGISKTKFCKNGQPKRSGNYSPGLGIKTRDYPVELIYGVLIVGEKTPLSMLMPSPVIELALSDPFFDKYYRKGTYTYNGEQYECEKILIKSRFSCLKAFTYRELITTHNDFDYKFPEY